MQLGSVSSWTGQQRAAGVHACRVHRIAGRKKDRALHAVLLPCVWRLPAGSAGAGMCQAACVFECGPLSASAGTVAGDHRPAYQRLVQQRLSAAPGGHPPGVPVQGPTGGQPLPRYVVCPVVLTGTATLVAQAE
jgi:hypothetical protein